MPVPGGSHCASLRHCKRPDPPRDAAQGIDPTARCLLRVRNPIERVTTDPRDTHFQVSTQGRHTCPGCGRQWAITLTATWVDPSPPADPEEAVAGALRLARAVGDAESHGESHPQPRRRVSVEGEDQAREEGDIRFRQPD